MTRTRPHPRSAEGERTKKEILQVSLQLFAENGYSKTTISQIAERARTYRSSVDWHFGSKEGLLIAVIENFLDEEVPNSIQEIFQDYLVEHPEAQTEDLITSFYFQLLKRLLARHFTALMTLFRITFEEMPHNPTLNEKILAFWNRMTNNITDLIRLSQETQKISDQINPVWTARGILALAQGLFMQWYLERDRLDVEASVSTLVSGVMRLLLLDPEEMLAKEEDWRKTIQEGK